ncbi:substrate-binding domain-containing protein [Solirubrobacter deserti]|uniref:Substrate-binding domain-containing protein n=1 Tax=Solirubrobacter deserti TaxID=2282478 RepID=A0ABT4RJE3_9ACTN|nr:substrate-binding domain-containing protein [Solirubrobacter deserti]MDA0138633.1 substrate-binding domain-containing protein [Solirubrobacter deserti]
MIWRRLAGGVAMLACCATVAACGSSDDPETTGSSETPVATETTDAPKKSLGEDSEFFNQEEMDKQLAQRSATPEGPADKPWLQMIEPEMKDTSEFKSDKSSGWNVCFSNAASDNPWRQNGFKTMKAEADNTKEIAKFTVVDAEAKDDKQISDIEAFVSGGECDALIVSPNTTATLTPAVEKACESDIPVIVFDRGVTTDCPVTFVAPIGGYAYGADGAEFLRDNVKEGGKILALRILPGVDVLETRWSGAKGIFEEAGLNVVGVEFTDGDPAKTKSIVSDYLQREGSLDGVWMDAGATAVAAVEAFEDAGQEVPFITGEDQNDFLTKWKEDGLKAIAPTYSNFQWRTAVIAAVKVLKGEEVPSPWVLPQPKVTQETLDQYVKPDMGPLYYALCGCEDLPGFPEKWQ